MERKVTAVYTVFSVLAFVFLASWLAYTFFQTRANNFINAASTFEDIGNSTAITFNSTGRFGAPRFRSFVRSLFLEIPSLDVLSISTSPGGVQYVYARHTSNLVSPHVADDRWSGSIRYSRLTQAMFSGPLPPGAGVAGTPFRVHAVFTILSRSNLYSIGRTLLLFLLSFVILTLIVVLIAPAFEGRGTRPPRDSPAEDESPTRQPTEGSRRFEEARDATPARDDTRPGFNRSADQQHPREVPSPQRSSVIVLGPPPLSGKTVAEEAATIRPTPERDELQRPVDSSVHIQLEDGEKQPEPSNTLIIEEREEPLEASDREVGPETRLEAAPPAAAPPAAEPPEAEPAEAEPPEQLVEEVPIAPPDELETLETKPPIAEGPLPPGVSLPSLHEVLGEEIEEGAGVSEISMYEEMSDSEPMAPPSHERAEGSAESPIDVLEALDAGESEVEDAEIAPAFEVTEVEEHSDRSAESAATPVPSYRSAEDDIADIDDFEDLERLDGSHGGEPVELPPRRRPPVERKEQRAAPAVSPAEPEILSPEEEPEIIELDLESEEPTLEMDIPPDSDTITVPDADELAESDVDSLAESQTEELRVTEVEELQSVEGDDSSPASDDEAPVAETFDAEAEAEAPGVSGESGAPLQHPPEDAPHSAEDAQTVAAPGSKHARELFNPESGLAWSDHLEQRLSFELDRAASFDQDLALCVVRFAQPADDVGRLNYAREIRTYFPFHDLCFEYDKDAFAVVLPNTDIDQAIRSMENFNEKMHEDRPASPKMLFGLSARNGRLLGSERLLSEAETAIEKAREDRHNSIFALRVDPGKYREFIKSSLK